MFLSVANSVARRSTYLFAALAVFATCRQAAQASDYSRVAPGSGSFFNSNLWSPTGVPGNDDRAIFDLSSAYSVTFPTRPFLPRVLTTDRLRIGHDQVTFDLNDYIYNLTSTTSTSLSVGGNSRFLSNDPDYAHFWITNGTIHAESVTVGDGTDIGLGTQGSGTLRVRDGGTLISDGMLTIGNQTTGEFIIEHGGDVTSFLATIGSDARGVATVHGAGSTWTTDSVDVGAGFTDSSLSVGAGAVMNTTSSSETFVAVAPGVSAMVDVFNAGSRWDLAGPMVIGHGGSGDLQIGSGAVVQSTAENATTVLGNQSGSSGQAHVEDAGSRWVATRSSHRIIVGNLGSASVEVLDGGEVSFGQTSIGAQPVGIGTVVLNGAGSIWNSLDGLFVGGSAFADGGNGTFTIGAGAQAIVGTAPFFSQATKVWGSGTINLDGGALKTGQLELLGGEFNWTTGLLHLSGSALDVQLGGLFGTSLSLTAGQNLRAIEVNVGANDDGVLTAAAGTSITADFGLVVGGAADGDLQTSGMLTTSRVVTIGDQTGSIGTVTVENGAVWDHSDGLGSPLEFIVGDNGAGTLNVLSGASVAIRDQAVPELGNGSQGHGTMNIDGTGSELTIELHDLSVGRMGYGVVNITGGGELALPASAAFVGDLDGAHGEMLVQGTASILSAGAIVVGNFGTGTLDITDEGTVAASEIYIALGDTSGGSMVTLNGPGSRLSALTGFGTLIVGGGSTGSLNVAAEARAEAVEIFIGDGTFGVGSVLVTGAGSQLSASEQMAVGYNGQATLTVADGGTASAPFIDINDQSTVIGNGVLQGEVTNMGVVSPGTSPGTLTIDGSYEQATSGELLIEFDSIAAFDQLQVTSAATLAGTLEVALLPGFTLSGEHFFTILTASVVNGQFDTELLPSVANMSFDVIYNPGSVVLHVIAPELAGDFNRDGIVDAADYVAWRKLDGTQDGYDAWQANFGETTGGGSAENSTAPEPASVLTLLFAIAVKSISQSAHNRVTTRWCMRYANNPPGNDTHRQSLTYR